MRALTAVLLASASPSLAFDIVRDGEPSATIVIPDEPLPVVQFAADELRHHVQVSTSAELPVVTESDAPVEGNRIFLGACEATEAAGIELDALPPNGFLVKLVGDSLFMAGDDSDGPAAWVLHNNRTRAGTMFAVYEFLETHLGCRWLWPGPLGEVIPKRDTITVDAWDQAGKPPFIHSRWRDGGAGMAGERGWADPQVRSRFLTAQGQWLRRHRFAMGVNMDMKHAFAYWWDEHGETHPEYFNLLPDGTRRSDPTYHGGSSKLVSMCISNPDFIGEIIRHWQATRSEANPYIDASENDTPGKCTCDRCMAWDVEDPELEVPWPERLAHAKQAFEAGDKDWAAMLGSGSDRYARFYLEVQAEAEKTDPEAVIMGFAYANYVKPPIRAKLNDRIIIGIVPPLMAPWTDEKRAEVREQWQGWAAAGARLFLRPNYMLDGHNMPLYFAHKLGEDFQFHASHGMIGTDFDSLTGQYATQGPNLYMLARLHARPELTVAEVLDEFHSAFGPAKDQVRAYFDHWQRVSDAVTEAPEETHWSYYYRGAHAIFTPEAIDQGQRLLDAAAARAAEGDDLASQRVGFLQHGLENARLTLATQAAYREYREAGDLVGFREAITTLDEYRASIEGELGINMCYLAWNEVRTWDRELLRIMAEPGQKLPDPWRFAWDPENAGEGERWSAEGFDDGEWLDMPTDGPWEQQPPGIAWREEHGGDYDGFAWYRTEFTLDAGDQRPIVRLVFGAVDEACVIWVNGEEVLRRPFPYQGNQESWQEAFEVDISDVVRLDGANTLAVRVEDNAGAGGIWRPVWVVRSAAPAEGNVVPDPGFEEAETAWGRSIMCGSFTLEVDNEEARSGRASGRLTCTELGPPEVEETHRTRAWARWYQSVPADPERTYRLRFSAKTTRNFAGTLRIWVTGTEDGTTEAKLLSTDGLWREITVTGIKPKAESVGIYLNLMDAMGTAWFDDVELISK